jgi:probable phosphoglycerate mutase
MTKIVLTRHGQTEWNRLSRKQGWCPTPLNERGKREAKKLARYIRNNYNLAQIHSSDLLRAQQTAEIVCEAIPEYGAGIVDEKRLRERNLGVLQGVGEELVTAHSEYFLPIGGRDAISNRPENGESYGDMIDRAIDWWESALGLGTRRRGTNEGGIHLVVTHGGVIRAILANIRGMGAVKAFEKIPRDNCAVNEILLSDEDVRIQSQNRTTFL